MLSKINELDEVAVKFQKTITDMHTELASAKTEAAKAEADDAAFFWGDD